MLLLLLLLLLLLFALLSLLLMENATVGCLTAQNQAEKFLKRFGIVVEGDKIVDMYGKSYDIPDAVLTHWAFMSRLEYMSKLYKIDSFKDLKFLASYLRVDYDALKHFKFQYNSIYIDYYRFCRARFQTSLSRIDACYP